MNGLTRVPKPQNEPILGYELGSSARKQLQETLKTLSSDSPVQIPLAVGEERRHRKETFDVRSPQNKNKVIATASSATEKDIEDCIHAAVKAQKDWTALPWEERANVFLRAAELLAGKYRAKINAATMLGQGKSCHQAEIDAACELIDFLRFNAYFAQKIYEEQPLYSPAGQWNRAEANPLEGFVYAIGPFNFTAISLNLATSCILMGNSVVWKPAATALLSSYVGLQALEEAGLPPGVLNLVTGSASLISRVTLSHPALAGIHFTGSTGVFNQLWTEVGKNISQYRNYPRLVGETGGKNFVFAHPSADEQQLIIALVRGAFEYQGQKCSAASRAYIPSSLWKNIKEQLISEIQSIKVGDPADFGNFMNAVIDKAAFDKIKSYIDHARSSSEAEVLCGGECDDRVGYFIRPTLIQSKSPSYKSMHEEIFGPVLTVYVYEDSEFEATLKVCEESSPYALTGSIFAQDRRVLHKMSETLKRAAGNFYINDKPTGAVVGQQPFGGARKSGTNDKAGSMYNLLRWVSHRSIKENFTHYNDYRYPFMS
ncbi:MAG: L-glutamate gamma-semialdehyde dehydrogenase [Oligoflexales bacterium]|nr:L-glutamate gamma-semialdehyde dehydrogenase [Oligoflexales bacterium]